MHTHCFSIPSFWTWTWNIKSCIWENATNERAIVGLNEYFQTRNFWYILVKVYQFQCLPRAKVYYGNLSCLGTRIFQYVSLDTKYNIRFMITTVSNIYYTFGAERYYVLPSKMIFIFKSYISMLLQMDYKRVWSRKRIVISKCFEVNSFKEKINEYVLWRKIGCAF